MTRGRPRTWILGALVVMLGPGSSAEAGWLIAPGVKWSTFSSRPEDGEPTPNYYGYGGNLSLGYSAGQIADFALYGQYVPGRLGSATPGAEDATWISYGGEFAFRISSSIYVGLRGGIAAYKLLNQTRDEELSGGYDGPGGGISIGAIHKLSKTGSLQTSFDLMHGVLEPTGDQDTGRRRFDAFSVTFSYVYNGYKSRLIESNLFQGFLDSIIFF